jgi:4'-phosphopantetheinyl transferase
MHDTLFWLIQNLQDLPEGDDWLSAAEQSISAGLRFPKRRNDWRLGRWTAKKAILAYRRKENSVLSSLEIRAAADGAPEAFWNDESGNISVSISHSHERCFCVVGSCDFSVGCDLERIEPRENNLFSDYFTPEEVSYCAQAPDDRKSLTVNLIWSCKESALKVLRQGLRRDTRSIVIHPDPWERDEVWNAWTGHCLETSQLLNGWWRSCNGFVYTLASNRTTSVPEPLRLLS